MVALVQQSAASVSKYPSTAYHSCNSACSGKGVSLASAIVGCSPGRRRGHLMMSGGEPADKVMPSTFTQTPRRNVSQRQQKFVAAGSGRRVLYGDAETYVLLEPGEDEQFVTSEELQERLKLVSDSRGSSQKKNLHWQETVMHCLPQVTHSIELGWQTWLQEWPGRALPVDLAKFRTIEDAVAYLMDSVCELDLGDGQGSLQWFEVRLD